MQVVLPWVGAGASYALFPGWLDTLKGRPSLTPDLQTACQRQMCIMHAPGVWKDMGKEDTEFDDLCRKLQAHLPEVTDSMGDHAELTKGAKLLWKACVARCKSGRIGDARCPRSQG